MPMIKRLVKFLWFPLLCCFVVFLLFRFVLFLGYVPSKSMEPTIPADSFIIGNRLYGELHRGDMVIFEKEGRCLVKRIAAVPGDTVYINDRDRSVSVNAELEGDTRIITVPENSYFVLGDNADVSVDSRYWENSFISKDCIRARMVLSG